MAKNDDHHTNKKDAQGFNQVLIKPVHMGPTLKNILPILDNLQYLPLIDASSGYHTLWLDEKSSYLMMLVCQFGRYK